MANERTVVVGIGRGTADGPMSLERWSDFVDDVKGALAWLTIYTVAYGEGEWNGEEEESATFVAGGVLADAVLESLRRILGGIAREYGQEAIALTIGTTEFVSAP